MTFPRKLLSLPRHQMLSDVQCNCSLVVFLGTLLNILIVVLQWQRDSGLRVASDTTSHTFVWVLSLRGGAGSTASPVTAPSTVFRMPAVLTSWQQAPVSAFCPCTGQSWAQKATSKGAPKMGRVFHGPCGRRMGGGSAVASRGTCGQKRTAGQKGSTDFAGYR